MIRFGNASVPSRTGICLTSLLFLITASGAAAQVEPKQGHHHELKQFEGFLTTHPSIAADIDRDPTLIKNPDYIAKHPELKEFIDSHPGLVDEVLGKAQTCAVPIPSIFDKASPAVVYIYATSINPYRTTNRVEHIVGSGFIFDPSGLILTNSHVAFPRESILVGMEDGTTAQAELVGADPIFDIAVLRIKKADGATLPALALGDSDLVHVGADAIAIGNPLGLDQTLTRGTVSAINRVLPATFFSLQEPLIQIDTPINPGNSGGPLLDRCGQVIGITTAMISQAQDIGFAIPINLIKAVLPSLTSQGRVARPWLGFHGQAIDANLQALLKLPLVPGFMIEVVEPGSPAEKAGVQGGGLELTIGGHEFLLGGDIITKMNGLELNSVDNMAQALKRTTVGSTVTLTVFRQGDQREITYAVPERPLLPGDIAGPNASMELTHASPVKSKSAGPPPGNTIFRF
ncbi:MAG TPA: trypsin-like peptidase domain-containing protein [Blastocatellia bacterium]|nr:trypsin-like peptidase domain-containing protein [Blastocatellia bacterium]